MWIENAELEFAFKRAVNNSFHSVSKNKISSLFSFIINF